MLLGRVLESCFSARVYRDVPVPMRDGIVLRADVWAPEGLARVPILLERLPYDKSISVTTVAEAGLEPLRAVEAGYAVVVQDTRGRFASDGAFQPYVHEAQDGVDTITWCTSLPFSDGRVAMFGASYFGSTQLLAAAQAPEALRAFAPTITGSEFYEGWTYQGGAFQLGFVLYWTLLTLLPNIVARLRTPQRRHFEALLSDALADPSATYRRLPLSDLGGLETLAPFYLDWLEHDRRDAYWRALAPNEGYSRVTAPALHIGGWHDLFVAGTLENFVGLRNTAATSSARDGQRLLVGPWSHGNFSDTVGELHFGVNASKAALDPSALLLGFFDEHMLHRPGNAPPVRFFLMGADEWVDAEEWPVGGIEDEHWYLHSSGAAAAEAGDGRLALKPCASDEPADDYVYDPHDPVETHGGATFLPGLFVSHRAGAKDQRAVETRRDVLVYTSDPLQRDLDVIGAVRAELSVSTSAPDTDFTAKLVDVHADGAAYSVCDGIRSLRHRDDGDSRDRYKPGDVAQLVIELGPTAMRFRRGHRLRLEISSSNFPRFARNPNNGMRATEARGSDFRTARQRVFHDLERRSFLTLPVRG